jgi:hypothetical protein
MGSERKNGVGMSIDLWEARGPMKTTPISELKTTLSKQLVKVKAGDKAFVIARGEGNSFTGK